MITNASIWSGLRDRANNNVWDTVGAGAPTNGTSGTGANLTGPGSTYTDVTNKIVYINTNTLASPTWTAIGGAGGGNVTLTGTQTLTNKTLTAPAISAPTFSGTAAGTLTNLVLVTPTLGVALATSVNGLTMTTSTGTLTVPNGVVLTGPAASGTAATLANAETLSGPKTLTAPVVNQPVTLHPVQALAAAGTNQGNAAAITLAGSGIVYVTAANATKGVLLPVGAVGMRISIANDNAANAVLNVYGNTGDSATINAVAGGTAYAQVAKTTVDFLFVAAAKWQTLPLIGS